MIVPLSRKGHHLKPGFGSGKNVRHRWIAGRNLTAPTEGWSYRPSPMQNQTASRDKYPRLQQEVRERRRLRTNLSHSRLIQLNCSFDKHCRQYFANPLYFALIRTLFQLNSEFTPTGQHSPLPAARELMIRLMRHPQFLLACG